MKRIILLLAVLLMTGPVMAAPVVNITCTMGGGIDGNEITVSYAVTGTTHLVRAFGLLIQCDDPCVAITQVVPMDANYRIYPGQIEIEGGEVTDYNTPYAADDLGDANVAIEMASLYTFDANYAGDANAGYGRKPGQSGVLLKFYVDEPNGCFDVNENPITGGVVMEDPCEYADVYSPGGCYYNECYCGCYWWPSQTQAECDEWVAVGKPECWCWPRQCHGDADGPPYGKTNWWVSAPDLAILKSAWQIDNGPHADFGYGICADFDHLPYGKLNWRVAAPDLEILKSYWQIDNGPEPNCLPGNIWP